MMKQNIIFVELLVSGNFNVTAKFPRKKAIRVMYSALKLISGTY